MSRSVTRTAGVLLALGALAYTAWLLEVLVVTGLDPVRTYVSELAAADQPLGGLFRATDLAAGLLVLAGALTGLAAGREARPRGPGDLTSGDEARPRGPGTDPGPRAPSWAGAPASAALRSSAARPSWARQPGPVRPRRPWLLTGWAALAVFGAATAVDSRLPLSCAPTADPACAARETAGLVPATHTAHAVSSGLAMTGALVALVALTVAARRHGRWPALARTGPVLVVVELAATAWTLAAVAAFEAGRGIWSLGAGQRLQVLLVAVWLAVLAVSLLREER
ncbi:DUF998 domain-containing protein [Streptomyces sp. SP18ES09]|uniref:DUF998 domain-containing protein n=1 Tax=Streptomyces sp. SP18ES09 TaxID=3002532 RepID=UPI002E77F590|nr:DUF998 domain-containing protein [Streptomyces sp. SP18ES09]MEE1818433.1 DUF998 domain-containing protein [Streptomyces sp. SP18ES09]